MKYIKLLLLFAFMTLLQGCPKLDDDDILVGTINIVNDSNETIYYVCWKVSETEINSADIKSLNALSTIEAKKSSDDGCSFYKNQFKGDYNKKIWILIYKQSTIDSHSWEEIQKQNLYDKRYSFTLDELNAMNWEVIYDGN